MAIKMTFNLADDNAGILRPSDKPGQRINRVIDRYLRIMREERQFLTEELTSAELDQLNVAFKAYTGNVRDFNALCTYLIQAMPSGILLSRYLQELGDTQMTALLELLEDTNAATESSQTQFEGPNGPEGPPGVEFSKHNPPATR